ncbi:MAG: hypothetical protein R3C44_22495 [Chloroflexota bacterium]
MDADRVFVLGNSEGTLHAALNTQVSDDPPPFAGLILAAPPGRPLSVVLLDQVEHNLLADNPDKDQILSEFSDAMDAFIAGDTPQPNSSWPDALQTTFAGLVAPPTCPSRGS